MIRKTNQSNLFKDNKIIKICKDNIFYDNKIIKICKGNILNNINHNKIIMIANRNVQ